MGTATFAADVTRVLLVINEAFADRAVAWPITTGVPFPRGALKKAENEDYYDRGTDFNPFTV